MKTSLVKVESRPRPCVLKRIQSLSSCGVFVVGRSKGESRACRHGIERSPLEFAHRLWQRARRSVGSTCFRSSSSPWTKVSMSAVP